MCQVQAAQNKAAIGVPMVQHVAQLTRRMTLCVLSHLLLYCVAGAAAAGARRQGAAGAAGTGSGWCGGRWGLGRSGVLGGQGGRVGVTRMGT